MTNNLIYGLRDPISKELRYVGQSSTGMTRPKTHLCPSNYNKPKLYIYNWIRTLVTKGLMPEIIVLEECLAEDLNELEEFYISYFKFLGCLLTNCTKGGDGIRGYSHSVATKAKMSKSSLGKVLSVETRKKIGIANKERTTTDETKVKLSQSLKGRNVSAETRAKISDALKGRKASADAIIKNSEGHKGINQSSETRAKRSAALTDKSRSAEIKAKMSAAQKGRIVTEEAKIKNSEAHKGVRLSEETKAKIRAARLGKPRSAETRAKISATKKCQKANDYSNLPGAIVAPLCVAGEPTTTTGIPAET